MCALRYTRNMHDHNHYKEHIMNKGTFNGGCTPLSSLEGARGKGVLGQRGCKCKGGARAKGVQVQGGC